MPTPSRDQKLMKRILTRLQARPSTVQQLAARLKVPERTVYRYLKYVEKDAGVPLLCRKTEEGVFYFC